MTAIAVKPSLDEVLEHHGVKGMHWGVRKAGEVGSNVGAAYSARMTKASNEWASVANGTGTKGQRFRTLMSTPVHKLVLGQRKSFAAKQSAEIQAHVDRINNGQTKVKDVLNVAHNLRYSDLIKGFRETSLNG